MSGGWTHVVFPLKNSMQSGLLPRVRHIRHLLQWHLNLHVLSRMQMVCRVDRLEGRSTGRSRSRTRIKHQIRKDGQ